MVDDAQGGDGSAASLAATVLEEEDAREIAHKRAREQVIFPDELLPGVNSEPVSFSDAFRVGGKLMFIVLGLLLAFDELEGAAISVLAPEIRRTFGISEGAIVFIATASSAFFVLGAVPMGWLADRVKRVPIVGWASIAFGFFVFLSGLATSTFMLFWTRFATGIAKANSIPVHQSLIADNYPIGIRARMSSVMNMGSHGIGLASPVLCAAIATWAGGVEGWRWAWFLLGIPVILVALLAFTMKEPPRGQFEKQDVLGEVIEDAQPAPVSMEAAFARIKRIRTIRTVLVAFCALGFGLFSQPALESLYLEDTLHVNDLLQRGLILSLSGIAALPILPFVGSLLRPGLPHRPGQGAGDRRCAHPPVGAPGAHPVQRGEQHVVLDPEDPAVDPHRVGVRDGGAGAPGRRAVPPARDGHRDVHPLHLLHRRLHGRPGGGLLHRRDRCAGHGDPPRRAQCDHRRSAVDERCALHPQRPLVGRRRAAGGTGRASEALRRARRRSPPAAREHRLLVRPGAGALRSRLRRAKGRDARAARHERRGQVDGACASSAASRFPNAASSASTVRTSRTSRRSSGPSSSRSCSFPVVTACSATSRSNRT